MRLGGPIHASRDPEAWVAAARQRGYRAVLGPLAGTASDDEIRDKLGPYIKSCHAKDIQLSGVLTVHLDEVRPGLGALDYRTLTRELDRLDPEMPLLLEHLPREEEYVLAAGYLRSVARELAIDL